MSVFVSPEECCGLWRVSPLPLSPSLDDVEALKSLPLVGETDAENVVESLKSAAFKGVYTT
jgi:hypothetical protein